MIGCELMSLTDKQEAFVQALVRGLSQREAYYEAYPKSKKWSEVTVDSNASRLAKNSKVVTRLHELTSKVKASAEKKCIISTEQVLQQLAEIGLADMRDLFDDDGVPLPPNRLPDRIARCITSVDTSVDSSGNVYYKYRLNPKDKSLALMAQILGMLQPKQTEDDEDNSINITPVYGRDDDG